MRDPHSPRPFPAKLAVWAWGLNILAVLLAFLIVGRGMLIPLLLALILGSVTTAAIDRLRQIRLAGRQVPNWAASLLAILIVTLGLIAFYSLLSTQISVVMAEAPAFITQAQAVILRLTSVFSDDLAAALAGDFSSFNARSWLGFAMGSAGNLLSATVMILIYVGFLLAERPWSRAKLARLFPETPRRTQIEDTISAIRRNIHQYLLVKTFISLVTAGVVYVIAALLGLQFAGILAGLSFFLNFIPNIGSIIATILPVMVALVQFDSLSMALVTLVTLGSAQFILGNILDPMLTGRSLQMSALGIIISLTFWSAIWGIAGMFLAVPLMVILMIICAEIPPLRAVAVLLSKTGEIAELRPEKAKPEPV